MKFEIKNLTKKFKNTIVIDNVNVTFDSGKIYGIIGKNGSGKSVFLKILCSFYVPTSGYILQDNYDYIKNNSFPKNTRALIEKPDFISELTGFENLKLLASIQNRINDSDIEKTLKDVNLFEEKDKKYCQYSLGMKQKLGIIQAIMEDPVLLVLDEPTSALDETTINIFRNYLNTHKDNKIIVMTSHNKDDINTICTHVFTMTDGVLQETA